MAIQIIDSFDLKRPIPLDDRSVVSNLSELPTNYCYEGMLVYQRVEKRYYKFENGIFSPLSEASGVSEFNSRTGNISIIQGPGISINEFNLREFTISTTGVIRTITDTKMDPSYVPSDPQDVTTVQYVDTAVINGVSPVSDDLSSHKQKVATYNVLGHIKIDDSSLKTDVNDRLYLNQADGGTF